MYVCNTHTQIPAHFQKFAVSHIAPSQRHNDCTTATAARLLKRQRGHSGARAQSSQFLPSPSRSQALTALRSKVVVASTAAAPPHGMRAHHTGASCSCSCRTQRSYESPSCVLWCPSRSAPPMHQLPKALSVDHGHGPSHTPHPLSTSSRWTNQFLVLNGTQEGPPQHSRQRSFSAPEMLPHAPPPTAHAQPVDGPIHTTQEGNAARTSAYSRHCWFSAPR
jgi:hypothetical protein